MWRHFTLCTGHRMSPTLYFPCELQCSYTRPDLHSTPLACPFWWGTRTPMLGPSNTVCLCSKIKCLLLLFITHLTTTTTTVLRPFFRDHPGEPVPEEKFWTLWCKGRLTEADKPSIRLGATPSGLTSAHLHHPPHLLLISAQYNQL